MPEAILWSREAVTKRSSISSTMSSLSSSRACASRNVVETRPWLQKASKASLQLMNQSEVPVACANRGSGLTTTTSGLGLTRSCSPRRLKRRLNCHQLKRSRY